MHLTIDGKGDPRLLNDVAALYGFLEALPDRIAMTPIAPVTLRARPAGGFVGIVIIAESHISIHTDLNGQFWADVFSCKDFSVDTAKAVISGTFGVEASDLHSIVLDRGNLPALAREGMVI